MMLRMPIMVIGALVLALIGPPIFHFLTGR